MAHHQLIFIQIWASEINVSVGNIKAVDGTTQNLVTVLYVIVHSAAYDLKKLAAGFSTWKENKMGDQQEQTWGLLAILPQLCTSDFKHSVCVLGSGLLLVLQVPQLLKMKIFSACCVQNGSLGLDVKKRSVVFCGCRFCLLETSCEQDDNFPPSICVRVNSKMAQLPVSTQVWLLLLDAVAPFCVWVGGGGGGGGGCCWCVCSCSVKIWA